MFWQKLNDGSLADQIDTSAASTGPKVVSARVRTP
jgi:hypothetical protein